ncbi:hypothetical protein BCV70DRAFT_197891 [Testicularia cyperi]|uniref:TFIIS N-terminal domain-containing protein n=1 Tax=Testicularia cyperi TaxID=1882483 RepID=A0A317Y252_9BASI|nr:hypothetical protein BCV70DRAFT_197891 [Testicularia cyperi]
MEDQERPQSPVSQPGELPIQPASPQAQSLVVGEESALEPSTDETGDAAAAPVEKSDDRANGDNEVDERGDDAATAAVKDSELRERNVFDEDDDDEPREQHPDEEDALPSFRKRDADRTDRDRDDGEAAVVRKKKKKRHLSPDADVPRRGGESQDGGEDEAEPEDDPYAGMTEAEIRRNRTTQMIEDALRAGKKRAPRKRAGEEDLDLLADEEVAALRRQMVNAADDDEEANRLKKPATNKLRLLPKVVATLQKNHLQQSILDNNLLEGVKRWLEPLPDKSLPALNIQHQFFQILTRMSIDTISLKMSGLGKVVVFYSMCPRVEPSIKRSAEHLIEVWSRPVLKRSSSYRDRHVQSAEWSQDAITQRSALSGSQIADNSRRNVGIPSAVSSGFRVAPQSIAGQRSDNGHEARQANQQRLNRFKSRLKEAKR